MAARKLFSFIKKKKKKSKSLKTEYKYEFIHTTFNSNTQCFTVKMNYKLLANYQKRYNCHKFECNIASVK